VCRLRTTESLTAVNVLSSILVLADRASEAEAAVRKASVMARHFEANIEIFACDTEHAWAIDDPSPAAKAVISSCLLGTERYLDALRGSVAGNDLQITTRAACASSMEEGIRDRVRASHPDLVIKTLMPASDTAPMSPRPLEMQLMRCCAVPLLVTRGRSWRPTTKFAAAVDLDGHDPARVRDLIASVEFLAHGCSGEHALVRGRSVEEIVRFVEQHQIDVLVMDGPAEGSWQGPEPSLIERLLSVLECDVLILPSAALSAPRASLLS